MGLMSDLKAGKFVLCRKRKTGPSNSDEKSGRLGGPKAPKPAKNAEPRGGLPRGRRRRQPYIIMQAEAG